MDDTKEYSIGELAKAADVTPRTIRYYTLEGLLPPPQIVGRTAVYSEAHRLRLRLIARLKALFLPLHEIRARLAPLTDAELLAESAAEETEENLLGLREPEILERDEPVSFLRAVPPTPPAESAAEYVQRLLRQREAATPPPKPASSAPPVPMQRVIPPVPRPEPEGETWERYVVAEGLEVHLRQPATLEARALLDRLLREVKRTAP
jgi:DNA-binding transcriptional MerR regulator